MMLGIHENESQITFSYCSSLSASELYSLLLFVASNRWFAVCVLYLCLYV